MQVKELQELSRHLINRFKLIEPREWGIEGTVVELIGEVGSLAHCAMLYESYKRGRVRVSRIKDETSDILFVIFKLADVCGVQLPSHIEIEPAPNTLSELTIELSNHLGLITDQLGNFKNDAQDSSVRAIIGSNLIAMICLLGQIAALVGFSLEDAHQTELRIAELWLDTQLKADKYPMKLMSRLKLWLGRPLANFVRK